MPDLLCETCGEPTARTSEFCAACGAYLGWQDRPAEATQTAGPAAVLPVAAPEPAARPEVRPRSRVEERLLADSRRTPSPRGEALAEPVPVPVPVPVAAPEPVLARPPATAPAGPRCPSPACGAANPPERRFCARCGMPMAASAGHAPAPAGPPAAPAGLQRYLPHPGEGCAAGRRAYRQALPTRYRVLRGGAGAVALLLVAGLLTLLDHSPAAWARARFYDLTGRTTLVTGLEATADAGTPLVPDHPADALTDGVDATAWAAAWTPRPGAPATCATTLTPPVPAVLLTLPGRVRLKAVRVVDGLPGADRLLNWRPALLRLTFDDGSCQQVALTDSPGVQEHALRPTTASSVRVEVAAAVPPVSSTPGGAQLVGLVELQLLRRPG